MAYHFKSATQIGSDSTFLFHWVFFEGMIFKTAYKSYLGKWYNLFHYFEPHVCLCFNFQRSLDLGKLCKWILMMPRVRLKMWFQHQIPGVVLISVHCVLKGTAYASFYTLLNNTKDRMLKSDILSLKNSIVLANIV